ncbi:MAG: type II secretion system F family protein [Candidatus Woesearchaeota archaeon]
MKFLFAYEFGKSFIPDKIRPNLRKYLFKAGIVNEPYSFFGILFYFSLIFSISFYFLYIKLLLDQFVGLENITNIFLNFLITFSSIVLLNFLIIGFFIVIVYFFIDLIIYNRTKKLEEILPYFFDNLSANLKSGMSFDNALFMSIKPEFGILADEIAITAKKVMTGNDIELALEEFSKKYDSPMLKRSMELIINQLKEGGAVSDIIDKIAFNLKNTMELKQEIRTSVYSYVLFISIIVILISPVLFALSQNLFEIIKSVVNVLAFSMGSTDAVGFSVSEITITKEVFNWFSFIALSIIAIFSSMIVSIIEKGDIKSGVKYIPMYFIGSHVVYLIASNVLGIVFGGFIMS